MRAIFMLLAVLAPSGGAVAQSGDAARVRPADVLWAAAGGLLATAPRLLDDDSRAPRCAPCNPATVPWFDRWAVGQPRRAWDDGSTLLLAGLGMATWWDLSHDLTQSDWDRVTASMQSGFWALGVTELVKAVVARPRPVLFSPGAPAAARNIGNQRSMPSGHAAAAFALATSYALGLEARPGGGAVAPVGAVTAAAGVGALRIAARRHFLSDVLVGAAVGTLSALIVSEIRF